MAVTKPMDPFDIEISDNPDLEAIDVKMPDSDKITTMATEDGEIIIEFDDDIVNDETVEPEDLEHDTNFAELIDEKELEEIASDLVESFVTDRRSRKEWANAYIKGLDLLGMKIEERTMPWQGASGVFHPMLSSQYQDRWQDDPRQVRAVCACQERAELPHNRGDGGVS